MNPSSDPVVIMRLALLPLTLALCGLAVFTVAILIRRFIIIPKFRKEFLALHTRRVARARLALAGEVAAGSDDSSSTLLLAHAYPFSGWIDLGKDGTVTIAGQSFRPTEIFQAIARDGAGTPRAKAAGTGHDVLIESHGQTCRAKFTGTEWDVQLLEDDQP
jgi:hypothetical protein